MVIKSLHTSGSRPSDCQTMRRQLRMSCECENYPGLNLEERKKSALVPRGNDTTSSSGGPSVTTST